MSKDLVTSIEDRIALFRERLKTEEEFCKQLYEQATIRLLAFKYSYYGIKPPKHIVDDICYDSEEVSWSVMGRALGFLKEDETSPCVGFDHNHLLADKAIELALKLPEKKTPK